MSLIFSLIIGDGLQPRRPAPNDDDDL